MANEQFSRIRITKVINSKDGIVRWAGGQLQVTQEVLTTVNQEVDRKFVEKQKKS
ncbi:hypothetical protein GHI93_10065 [Lactococcus hircilactis]|uniref:Uncharacterized protein n=1 Tax=Lactococcus hircilactis TaxID=1494462 RepID=A0A7X2D2N6_9LACT|nr:hypothetical protein [Lactococcus hircilactis]MQW40270.1 hypothetical protein [Lactococcus hircilactis]